MAFGSKQGPPQHSSCARRVAEGFRADESIARLVLTPQGDVTQRRVDVSAGIVGGRLPRAFEFHERARRIALAHVHARKDSTSVGRLTQFESPFDLFLRARGIVGVEVSQGEFSVGEFKRDSGAR
jgi:hypothetical protein